MSNKAVKYLSSLRFTILLICLLGLMFIIGLWVPQARLVREYYLDWKASSPTLVAFLDALGLTTIYTSWITVTLWVLFFLNLALVMWQRLPLIKNRITLSETKIADPETAGGYPFRKSYPLTSGLDGKEALALIRKRGFTILGDAAGFYGVKNRLSPIAFGLFHLSFFLVLLGGLTTVYTEFSGYLDLAQGETFQGFISQYNKKPRPVLPKIGTPPNVSFMVKSIVPQVVRNTPTGINIQLVDNLGQTHEAGINIPYETDYTSFVFKHLGLAPLVVLKDSSGNTIDEGNVKLDVVTGKQDSFSMGGFLFKVLFYPEYALENGKPVTMSQEFKNPVFAITVEKDGKRVAEGNIPRTGAFEFPGHRLEIRDMPFWVRFYVKKQRGISILYAGFALASIGVMWRLLFYRREIIGAVREKDGVPCLIVAGRSEYYKSLAGDEFAKLFDGMFGKKAEG